MFYQTTTRHELGIFPSNLFSSFYYGSLWKFKESHDIRHNIQGL